MVLRRTLLLGASAIAVSSRASAQGFLGWGTGVAASGISLASTASFTIDALAPTFAPALSNVLASTCFTPVTVGTVAATGGSAVYTLSGAQSAGFAVGATTGAITLVTDFLMIEAGVIGQWQKTRVFTLTATPVSGTPKTCTVTVNLDTSVYAAKSKIIPGVDNIIGRTSVNALKHPVANPPTGWSTFSTNTGTVTLNGTTSVVGSGTNFTALASGYRVFFSNDYTLEFTVAAVADATHMTLTAAPAFSGSALTSRWTAGKTVLATADGAQLVDYRLDGWRIVNNFPRNSVVVDQCYFDYTTAVNAGTTVFMVSSTGAGTTTYMDVTNCTFVGRGREQPWGQSGLGGAFRNVTNCAFVGLSQDAGQVNRIEACSNCYYSSRNTFNRLADGVTINPVYFTWGHSDGLQSTIMQTGDSTVYDQCYVDNRAYTFDPVSQSSFRKPAGVTASLYVATQKIVTGSGTSWLTGSATDKLSPGDVVRLQNGVPQGVTLVVDTVDSETQFTAVSAGGNVAVNVNAGAILLVGVDPLTGVTSPMYFEGPSAATQKLTQPMSCTNSIVRGGGYSFNIPRTYSTLSGTASSSGGVITLTVASNPVIGNLYRANNDSYATEYTVTAVTSTTVFTVTPAPSPALSGATLVVGPFCVAQSTVEDNLIGDWFTAANTITRNNVSWARNYQLSSTSTLLGGTVTPTTPFI